LAYKPLLCKLRLPCYFCQGDSSSTLLRTRTPIRSSAMHGHKNIAPEGIDSSHFEDFLNAQLSARIPDSAHTDQESSHPQR
jgi:hypothetical protein